MKFVIRTVITAIALWISTLLLSSHKMLGTTSTSEKIWTLLLVAVIFGVVNAVLQPIAKSIGCGLYVLTLGLIALVVNGLLFMLTSWISGVIGLHFHVDKFWPTAVIGALIVGVVSWALSLVVPDNKK